MRKVAPLVHPKRRISSFLRPSDVLSSDQTAHFACSICSKISAISRMIRSILRGLVLFLLRKLPDLIFHCLSCGSTRQFFFNLNAFEDRYCDDFSLQVSIHMKQFCLIFLLTAATISSWKAINSFNSFVSFEKSFQHDFL